jgi:hypothetical protein
MDPFFPVVMEMTPLKVCKRYNFRIKSGLCKKYIVTSQYGVAQLFIIITSELFVGFFHNMKFKVMASLWTKFLPIILQLTEFYQNILEYMFKRIVINGFS